MLYKMYKRLSKAREQRAEILSTCAVVSTTECFAQQQRSCQLTLQYLRLTLILTAGSLRLEAYTGPGAAAGNFAGLVAGIGAGPAAGSGPGAAAGDYAGLVAVAVLV